MTDSDAQLPTGEGLVRHVEELARAVAAGTTDRVPGLVHAATALQAACDAAGPDRAYRRHRSESTGPPSVLPAGRTATGWTEIIR